MKPPAAGKGRPKGALNKTTRSVKEAIEYAAEGLGGADRLIAWAQENASNESAFWTRIYTRMVPVDVRGDHQIRVEGSVHDYREAAEQEIRDLWGEDNAPLIVERK